MTGLTYVKHELVFLKSHPEFTEKWLQDRIADDPTILGLGEAILLDRERHQEGTGRLDLLLTNPEQDRRYEVELMLGATDESHIIRCIEYWDIERRRYPGYEHCAVLIAEDITSRFLNVIALPGRELCRWLPSSSTHLASAATSSSTSSVCWISDCSGVTSRRCYRLLIALTGPISPVNRSSQLVDELLEIINEKAKPTQQLNYNKHYIGLSDGNRSKNFIYFRPRKRYLRVVTPGGWSEELSAQFDEAGLEAERQKDDELVFNLHPADFKKHKRTAPFGDSRSRRTEELMSGVAEHAP